LYEWLRRSKKGIKIKKDSTGITINASKATDFFIDPDGSYAFSNAPVLLKKIDNTKPFTFTVEMKPEYKAKYDAESWYYRGNGAVRNVSFDLLGIVRR